MPLLRNNLGMTRLAQRFPRDYLMHGTRTEQIAQAGNAVSSNAAWIGERVLAALA